MFSFAPNVNGDGDFVCFIGDLKNELECERFIKEIPDENSSSNPPQPLGLLCLSLHTTPSISVCCRKSLQKECRFFSLELTKAFLTEHMENDLELFSNSGLEGFAQLLANALKRPLKLDKVSLDSSDFFPLQLTYNVGNNDLIGVLRIPVKADNMCASVIDFMFDIRDSAPTDSNTYNVGSKRSREEISSYSMSQSSSGAAPASLTQDLSLASQSSNSGGNAGTAAVKAAKPKAKKRVGGVSLNPTSRKKK